MIEGAGSALQISATAIAAVAAVAGAACKLYDNWVDLADPSANADATVADEAIKIAVVVFMTLFLLASPVACLIFGAYAVICNLQGSADTGFWRAAGILPAICLPASLAVTNADLQLADLALVPLSAGLVYAESALFPEEMSWRKFGTRAATAAGAAAFLASGWGTPTMRFLAAWTAGYNLLSVVWAAMDGPGPLRC